MLRSGIATLHEARRTLWTHLCTNTVIRGNPLTNGIVLREGLRTIPVRDPVGLQRAFRSTHDRLMEQERDFRDAEIELPAAGTSLLNAVAYLRGWGAAQDPLVHVVPGGSAAHLRLCRLDTDLLDAWHELGTQSNQLAGFAELGDTDAEATKKAVPGMIQQARDALRQ